MIKYVGNCLLLFVKFFKIYWSIFYSHPMGVPYMCDEVGYIQKKK